MRSGCGTSDTSLVATGQPPHVPSDRPIFLNYEHPMSPLGYRERHPTLACSSRGGHSPTRLSSWAEAEATS